MTKPSADNPSGQPLGLPLNDQLGQASGAHHLTQANALALVRWLEALEDPMKETVPSFADMDWRTLAGTAARVIAWQAAQLHRTPLTLAQCRDLVTQHFEHGELIGADMTLIRAVEKAHGIGFEA